MPNSPTFSVAGMSTSTGVHHSPNLNSWGTASTSNTLTAPFGDSLSQSRSHYQPGYLMTASQNNNAPQGNQRVDEIPVVQTKAKMSQVLSRGSASEFGMESMFQSTRQRQTLADEDAPPMSSINDIPNEFNLDSSPARFQPRNSTLNTSTFTRRHTQAPSSASQVQQPVYIIVFGYPPDKYSATAQHFAGLGTSTEPDQNTEIVNCFRIGYMDIGDAMRAVRKNGDVMGGNWMIGVKWADPAQAEALLGQPILRNGLPTGALALPEPSSNAMAVDEPSPTPPSNTPTVGTPIRLAPSAAAFRKTGAPPKPATPQPQKAASASGLPSALPPPPNNTPNKGVLGQVSDLIFGW
ncbi:hypothetical protein BDQ17DRAFT_1371187 [Cyathus striatus]|nr:hypothetical protein BDQ17DRAFT_1371187 [Cyathus striatus]